MHIKDTNRRIRGDMLIKAFHLHALGRRERLRRHQHPDIALWKRRAGKTPALFQFRVREGFAVDGRRRRYRSRYDLDTASAA